MPNREPAAIYAPNSTDGALKKRAGGGGGRGGFLKAID